MDANVSVGPSRNGSSQGCRQADTQATWFFALGLHSKVPSVEIPMPAGKHPPKRLLIRCFQGLIIPQF